MTVNPVQLGEALNSGGCSKFVHPVCTLSFPLPTSTPLLVAWESSELSLPPLHWPHLPIAFPQYCL